MSNTYDLSGKRFGMLTVTQRSSKKTPHGDALWECVCDCGKTKIATSHGLRYGNTTHCGCQKGKRISERVRRNGHEPIHMYRIWQNMKTRCYNPKYSLYHRYGGRGITVCDEWLHNFAAFRAWCFENGYDENLTLDRINNDMGYSPDNCRFATVQEQANNRSTNRIISVFGEDMTLAQASRKYGIKQCTLYSRCVLRGESPDNVIKGLVKSNDNNNRFA